MPLICDHSHSRSAIRFDYRGIVRYTHARQRNGQRWSRPHESQTRHRTQHRRIVVMRQCHTSIQRSVHGAFLRWLTGPPVGGGRGRNAAPPPPPPPPLTPHCLPRSSSLAKCTRRSYRSRSRCFPTRISERGERAAVRCGCKRSRAVEVAGQ